MKMDKRLERLLSEDEVDQYLAELEQSAVFSALINHLESSKEFYNDIMKYGSDSDRLQLFKILKRYNISWE